MTDLAREEQRKRFEKWAIVDRGYPFPLELAKIGDDYKYSDTRFAWVTWQAAEANAAVAQTEETVVTLARELYDRFVMGGWEPQDAHGRIREILGMATVPSTPSAQWISPRKDLPDEDELVLVAVTCEEGDDNDEVTQRWEEVHEATMYRGGCDLIAATADGNEYMNEEILGWMPLPAPPSGDRATAEEK